MKNPFLDHGAGRSPMASKTQKLLAIAIILLGFVSQSATLSFRSVMRARAACISYVSNEEALLMAAAIEDLEEHFNGMYGYDWALFSPEELTIENMEMLSNRTRATVTFNIIPAKHWTLPIDPHDAGCKDLHDDTYHRKVRWNSGLFAREERLRSYDWFWKVEPGAQFSHDFGFDPFDAMRDTSIAYGVNGLAGETDFEAAKSLVRSAWSFVTRHRNKVQPEAAADITWLLGKPVTPSILGDNSPNADLDYLLNLGFNQHEPSNSRVGTSNLLQHQPHSCPSKPNDAAVHECPFDANFEMGSLELLRGSEFRAYFDHLDQSGTFLQHHIDGATIKAMGATLLLPRSSIWRMNEVACDSSGHAYCLPPDNSAAAIARNRRQFLASQICGDYLGWTNAALDTKPPLVLWQEYWDFLREGFNWVAGLEDSHRGHTSHSRYHSSMMPRPKYFREVTRIFPIPRSLPEKFPVYTGKGHDGMQTEI